MPNARGRINPRFPRLSKALPHAIGDTPCTRGRSERGCGECHLGAGHPMHAGAFLRKRWFAGIPAFDSVTIATIRSALFVPSLEPWLA
jgi:hypothetical protein